MNQIYKLKHLNILLIPKKTYNIFRECFVDLFEMKGDIIENLNEKNITKQDLVNFQLPISNSSPFCNCNSMSSEDINCKATQK